MAQQNTRTMNLQFTTCSAKPVYFSISLITVKSLNLNVKQTVEKKSDDKEQKRKKALKC